MNTQTSSSVSSGQTCSLQHATTTRGLPLATIREPHFVDPFEECDELEEKLSPPKKINDVLVDGGLPNDILATEITIATARSSTERNWPNKPAVRLGDFLLGTLGTHAIGKKEGSCFVLGETIEKTRRKTTMRRMHMLGIDIDNGETVATVIAAVKRLGLFAFVYTTHSHSKGVTGVAQPKFLQWKRREKIDTPADDLATMSRFLVEVRGMKPEVAGTVTGMKTEQTGEGFIINVSHAPMDKCRVLFALTQPFVFAEAAESGPEAVKLWGRKILGLARQLGLRIDEACLDPSRLFYGPRHDQGRPFESHLINGAAIDLAAVPQAGKGASQSDAFIQAGEELAGPDVDTSHRDTPAGVNLWNWVKQRGDGFEIADVYRNEASDAVRHENGVKVIIQCPFDGEHSNPGEEEDVACMVINASENDGGNGFVFTCQHATCRRRSRTDFICEAIRQGTFGEDVLFDDTYDATDREPEPVAEPIQYQAPEEAFFKLNTRIQALTKASSPELIQEIVCDLMALNPVKLREADSLNQIKQQTGRDISDLREAACEAAFERRKLLRAKGQKIRTKDGLLKLYPREQGFPELLSEARTELAVVNNGPDDNRRRDIRIATFGGRLTRLSRSPEDGTLTTSAMDESRIINEMNRTTRWVQIKNEREHEVVPSKDVAKLLLVDDEALFPSLRQIVRNPFFDCKGRLVNEAGFHWPSRCYYDPPPDFIMPTIPSQPTSQDVLEAREFILENLFSGFPFDDGRHDEPGGQSSIAHTMALLHLPFMRDLIPGSTPVHFITKPAPGTGASLLVDTILTIATGQAGAPHVEKENAAERRKALTARLMAGASYFWLDNINEDIDSATYALALTTGRWSDRVLGSSEEVTLPVTWTWIISGNNVDVSNEMSRRLAPIRLDAKGDPLKRTNFKHSDLPAWVNEHRPKLVAACLTLIRHWINQGMPKWSGEPLKSYEQWSRTMGGFLEAIGVDGFLGNRHLVRDRVMDTDSGFERFVQAWAARSDCGVPRPVVLRSRDGRSVEHDLVDLLDEHDIDLGFRAYDATAKAKALSSFLTKRDGRAVTIVDEGECEREAIIHAKTNRRKTREYWLELKP